MYRVYSVKINGRTLESRNIKELLARAVSAKRNPEISCAPGTPFYGRDPKAGTAGACLESGMVAVH